MRIVSMHCQLNNDQCRRRTLATCPVSRAVSAQSAHRSQLSVQSESVCSQSLSVCHLPECLQAPLALTWPTITLLIGLLIRAKGVVIAPWYDWKNVTVWAVQTARKKMAVRLFQDFAVVIRYFLFPGLGNVVPILPESEWKRQKIPPVVQREVSNEAGRIILQMLSWHAKHREQGRDGMCMLLVFWRRPHRLSSCGPLLSSIHHNCNQRLEAMFHVFGWASYPHLPPGTGAWRGGSRNYEYKECTIRSSVVSLLLLEVERTDCPLGAWSRWYLVILRQRNDGRSSIYCARARVCFKRKRQAVVMEG